MSKVKLFRTPDVFRRIFPRRVWGFSRSSEMVYLTFDDGPTKEMTLKLLEILKEKKVKATFFCVGENAKKYPELMKSMIDEGHAIGNHTMRHEKGTGTSKKKYFESIQEAAKYIDSSLFRPPYGRLPMNYTSGITPDYEIIMWTWLSYDFDLTVSEETILKEAESIQAGDILVLHDNVKVEERVYRILPKIIDLVHEKGLSFATISAS